MKWSSGPALKLMIGRTLGFVATFFIPLVLVRIFDPAAFGTYKQFFLLYATIFPLAQIGMAESLYYFLPSARHRGGHFLINAMLALTASGAACLLLLTLARGHIAGWMNNEQLAPFVPLVGAYLLFMLVSSVLEITLISRERYGRASLVYTISDVARASLLMLPALLFAELRWVLYGAVAFAALRLVATVAYVRGAFHQRLRASRRLGRAQLAYTAPFQLAVVFEILQMSAPHFAVAGAFDTVTYAIFAIGCLQVPLTDFIASSVCNVLMVKIREAASAGRRRTVIRLWRAATSDLAFVFIPLTALLWLVAGDLIVLLFTVEFAAAVPIFMIWVATVLLSIVQTDGMLRAYAETRFLVLINAVRLAVVVGIIGTLMLTGRFGLEGAVLASVVALTAGKALALWRLRGLLDLPLRLLLPWPVLARTVAAAVIAAAPAGALGWWAEAPNFVSLLLVTVTFSAIYLTAAALLGVVPDGVRSALASQWQRLRPVWPLAVHQGE